MKSQKYLDDTKNLSLSEGEMNLLIDEEMFLI